MQRSLFLVELGKMGEGRTEDLDPRETIMRVGSPLLSDDPCRF